jgi:type III pantothenate kinase
MLLAVDIGNTNTTMGVFDGKRLVRRLDITTSAISSCRETLKPLCSRYGIRQAIICSVVPRATPRLTQALRLLKVKPVLVQEDVKIPVRNRYRYPREVGQDRLVNAYAGIRLYAAPLVIVDFGTAITFDVISGSEEYRGGMICPGLQTSLDALHERTALLPRVRAGRPQEFIGRDTRASMLSGVVYGAACLTDGFIRSLRRSLGPAQAVATGGTARLVAPLCRSLKVVDPDLTLKGLMFLAGGGS